MAFKIAIASGKGGTGKTTVAVNLANYFSQHSKYRTTLVDCDVEEPNDAIFFPEFAKDSEKTIHQLIAEIDAKTCTYCRKCVEYCQFNAIVIIPPAQFAEINPDLCHSCGACLVACEEKAISEKKRSIGTISYFNSGTNIQIVEGRLRIGSAMQTMLIREVKKQLNVHEQEIILFDAPPGTSCPVVATVSDADYIILVTEPTPFGLFDLKLMVEMLVEMDKPYGVVVNKFGLGNRDIYEYLESRQIELIGEIPFNRNYASMYARGELFRDIPDEIDKEYKKLIEILEERKIVHEGADYFKW